DRHGGALSRLARSPGRVRAEQTGGRRLRPRREAPGARALMPETIVFHKGHGLPYSKGLTAQALSATGLSPERSFELAQIVEVRLAELGAREIDVAGLRELTEDVLLAEEGGAAVGGLRGWDRLGRLAGPRVVMRG